MVDNIKYVVVDLDGTLVRTDLFVESLLRYLKSNPFKIFQLILWLLQGRAYAKEKIAQVVDVEAEFLPYEDDLLDYLKQQKSQGKELILATATHQRYANQVAEHLGIFDRVMATEDNFNLKGKNKLTAIKEMLGDEDFIYAGDSAVDAPIWRAAAANIMVNAPEQYVAEAEKNGKLVWQTKSEASVLKAFLKEMRLHQYAKNVLIFVPLVTSHEYSDFMHLLLALLAFICFSFCASGVYFLNDLLDLQEDRRHRSKKYRPIASGTLPLPIGVAGALGLPILAFALSIAFLPFAFVGVLLVYFAITNAYSFLLKRITTVDVMTLAILYTLRVVAGAAATGVDLSSWLIAFSVFIFVSLAFMKRYIEVAALAETDSKVRGRGYSADDRETMFGLGITNFTAAVVILALYINSPFVLSSYASPEVLWLLCLIVLFWGNHIWVCARRGEIPDDPVVFAIKDRASQLVGVSFVVVLFLAKYIAF
ncbi:UbiA family prenyltransferase [Sneathiella litorea]|uniref:UbiA family prenyltransferase n=1 Tax=Sneathiella litorea TaxID=2606216 RepID=A0A6L8WAL8_9PROT|nr:UbiA family prenyltransferase [Sneathiella litorea]MZR31704.1 UbiA family prenyltransferase [Sneathiella litorea]